MGRKATGTVKFQNGKYLAIRRREYLGSFDTKEAAQAEIDAAIEIDSGKVPNCGRSHGTKWMVDREKSGDVRGIDSELSVWRNHVETAKWFDTPYKKLKPGDITAWLVVLSKKRKTIITRSVAEVPGLNGKPSHGIRKQSEATLDRQTVLHARRLAYGMFEDAFSNGLIPANPVAGSKMPKMDATADEEEDDWKYLEAHEIDALFVAIEAIVPANTSRLKPKTLARLEQRRAFYRAVYALAIYAGLRQGEIFGLHWEDINWVQHGPGDRVNCVQVRRTRRMGRAPKTESSKRRVPMLAPLRSALDQWRRHGGVVKTHGKVFPADGAAGQGNKPKELGGYFGLSYDAAWERRWRKLCTDRPSVTFHDLRHTCASHLAMDTWKLGLSELQIMKWMGHSDLKTTLRYMHLKPGSLNEQVRKAEAAAEAERRRPRRRS